jgi:hypothetical protein
LFDAKSYETPMKKTGLGIPSDPVSWRWVRGGNHPKAKSHPKVALVFVAAELLNLALSFVGDFDLVTLLLCRHVPTRISYAGHVFRAGPLQTLVIPLLGHSLRRCI